MAPRCISCFGPVTDGSNLCADCARIARSDMALPLGARLQHGRYEIGRTLGEPGGFGVTYLAWDTSLERRIAIKEFFPRHLVSRGAEQPAPSLVSRSAQPDYEAGLKGFLDEARRLAGLDHPNIVKVHDYCEAFGTGYLVMSYYEGHDLRQHTERAGGRLEWQEATTLVLPMLDGLAEVHRLGLIHRDIKPANTYLARRADGKIVPILIDFGAARWTTSTKELTAILTEGFAPLEQYPGCGPQGAYTDIYATAATLYAVISGRSPASAPSRLANAYVAHLTDLVPGVPRRLGDAIDQALSIQADDRPQSAAEFARMLRAAVPQAAPRSGATAPPLTSVPPSVVGDDDKTRIAPRGDAQRVPTQPVDVSVPTTRENPPAPNPKPFPKMVAISTALIVLTMILVLPKFISGFGKKIPPAPTRADSTSASSPQLEAEAMRHFGDARAASDAGDYSAAMKAAASLHALSERTDWPGQARFGWSARADSIASDIISACPADREMLLKRDSKANPPPCPAKSW